MHKLGDMLIAASEAHDTRFVTMRWRFMELVTPDSVIALVCVALAARKVVNGYRSGTTPTEELRDLADALRELEE